MSDDDPTVILCPRIEDMPVPPIKGATRDSCAKCAVPVWVAPSTRAIYADGLDSGEEWLGLHCIQCGMAMAELDEDAQAEVMKVVVHEAQLAELAANLPVREVPEEGQHQDHDQDDPDHIPTPAVAEEGPDQEEDQQQAEQVHS